jgi:DNA-binding transcriptional ArsR family regulator
MTTFHHFESILSPIMDGEIKLKRSKDGSIFQLSKICNHQNHMREFAYVIEDKRILIRSQDEVWTKPPRGAEITARKVPLSYAVRRTKDTLERLGEATAAEIAAVNERNRSIESRYLFELLRKGFVSSRRRGRKVYYRICAA